MKSYHRWHRLFDRCLTDYGSITYLLRFLGELHSDGTSEELPPSIWRAHAPPCCFLFYCGSEREAPWRRPAQYVNPKFTLFHSSYAASNSTFNKITSSLRGSCRAISIKCDLKWQFESFHPGAFASTTWRQHHVDWAQTEGCSRRECELSRLHWENELGLRCGQRSSSSTDHI